MKKWILSQPVIHPVRTIITMILLTLLMASGIRFVVVDDDFMKLLPENIPSRILWDEVEKEFSSTDFIYVAFGTPGESMYSPKAFADLWDFSQALEKQDMVEEVLCVMTTKRMDVDEDGFMIVGDLVPDRDLSETEIQSIRDYLQDHSIYEKRFLSNDKDYFNVIVRPVAERKTDVFAKSVVSTANQYLSGYDVHFGGIPYITGIVPSLIMTDVKTLIKFTLLIIVGVLLLNIRSIVGLASILLATVMSMMAMLGFLGYAYHFTGSEKFLFSLLNSSMPIILLTIANADSVHINTHFLKLLRKYRDRNTALAKVLDELYLPVIVTSVTTMLAFMTLLTAPITTMFGYGLAVTFGVAWALMLSMFLVPSMLRLKKWNLESKSVNRHSILEKLVNRFGKSTLKHPGITFWTGIVFILISIWGIFQVKVEVNPTEFFKEGFEIRESALFLDQHMMGSMNLTTKVTGNILDPKVLKEMEGLQGFLEEDDRITMSMSIVDIIKQMHRVVMDNNPEYETIPDSEGKVNNLFTLYSMSASPEDFASILDYDYQNALIVTQMKSMSTESVVDLEKKINRYIDENIGDDVQIASTGMFMFLKDFVRLVLQSSFTSIFSAIILVAIVAAIFFRDYRWGILAIIPLSGAVIINFGLMGLLGIHLNHIIGLLTSIIIGVGVDFAIHYIARFKLEAQNHIDIEEISQKTMEDVGYPIFLNVGSNFGFLALLFSVFRPINAMGGLATFSMISTALGTIVLLAPIMQYFRKYMIKIANK